MTANSRFLTKFQDNQLDGVPLSTLEDYGLSVRSLNIVEEKLGIIWMRQLDCISLVDVLRLGPEYMRELVCALLMYGWDTPLCDREAESRWLEERKRQMPRRAPILEQERSPGERKRNRNLNK